MPRSPTRRAGSLPCLAARASDGCGHTKQKLENTTCEKNCILLSKPRCILGSAADPSPGMRHLLHSTALGEYLNKILAARVYDVAIKVCVVQLPPFSLSDHHFDLSAPVALAPPPPSAPSPPRARTLHRTALKLNFSLHAHHDVTGAERETSFALAAKKDKALCTPSRPGWHCIHRPRCSLHRQCLAGWAATFGSSARICSPK